MGDGGKSRWTICLWSSHWVPESCHIPAGTLTPPAGTMSRVHLPCPFPFPHHQTPDDFWGSCHHQSRAPQPQLSLPLHSKGRRGKRDWSWTVRLLVAGHLPPQLPLTLRSLLPPIPVRGREEWRRKWLQPALAFLAKGAWSILKCYSQEEHVGASRDKCTFP